MEKTVVYGTRWCGDTRRALKVLDKRGTEYTWINIDNDPAGEEFVKKTNQGNRSVPTIVFPDSSILVEPSNQVLEEKLDSLNL
jgi:mycoredoxin